jgi:hypothetical protein
MDCRSCLRAFVALAAIMVSGCFIGVEHTRYSAPTIDDASVKAKHVSGVPVDKMFLLKDVAYFVYPQNEQDDEDVMIVPFPWVFKNSGTAGPTFLVGIGLKPNREGFVIDPAQIRLIRGGDDIVAPTRIIGIGKCGTSSGRGWMPLPVPPVVLPQGICTGFNVEFAIAAPDPRESFSIEVAGVTVEGVVREIPVVHFQERKRLDPVGAP